MAVLVEVDPLTLFRAVLLGHFDEYPEPFDRTAKIGTELLATRHYLVKPVKDRRGLFAHHLPGTVAEQALGTQIKGGDQAILVGGNDGHLGGGHHHVGEEFPGLAHLQVGPAHLGDVAEDRKDLPDGSAFRIVARMGINPDPSPILVAGMKDPHHHPDDRQTRSQGHHGRMFRAGKFGAIFVDGTPARIQGRDAPHLIQIQAQNALGGGVGIDNPAIGLLDHHPLSHVQE